MWMAAAAAGPVERVGEHRTRPMVHSSTILPPSTFSLANNYLNRARSLAASSAGAGASTATATGSCTVAVGEGEILRFWRGREAGGRAVDGRSTDEDGRTEGFRGRGGVSRLLEAGSLTLSFVCARTIAAGGRGRLLLLLLLRIQLFLQVVRVEKR